MGRVAVQMNVETKPDVIVEEERASSVRCALSLQLRKRFQTRDCSFELNVDLEIPAGITILFGPSGAGKTTILDCIAGLTTPESGMLNLKERVLFNGEKGIDVSPQNRRVGYVFQDLALFPHLSVKKNVQYGIASLPASEREERSRQILESFHVAELQQRKPSEISGGERQRVALARALVTDPAVLLLDEPLAALDAAIKSKIVDDLRAWNESHQIPILYVTHSREEVFALGERVIVLQNGKVIAQGTPHEVMTAPRQETIAVLAGFENIFDAHVTAIHEDRGTMTCLIAGSNVQLETPLVRADVGSALRVGIRAGDILLASIEPAGLSARNVIPGRVISLAQRDVIVVAKVNCGVELEVHLTLAARDSLQLQPGREVWLVIKTHSCHLMAS
ncbi:MAG: molybdenum ABC transporter ATP-binding protein [Acidobacteria bacterium]|nr:MAG: molybdenum ABC transporter ATP-binding protein [Acidobacteriota bacterium]